MIDLERARALGAEQDGLAVAITIRADGTPAASVVNAGVLAHPLTGDEVVGFVALGAARKLSHLPHRSRVTVLFRSGWDWIAVEGEAELAGPHDPLVGLPPDAAGRLVREVYAAAVGGRAEDWSGVEDAISSEAHTAVLVRPIRTYSNPQQG